MQTNAFKILPPKPLFPSLIDQHRPYSSSSTLLKPPKANSISTPNGGATTTPTTPTTTTITPVEVVDDNVTAFWDYQFLFVSQRTETHEPVTLRVVEGQVPADFPSGTYYLTGPGIFNDDHGSSVHPLDGHGYLRAFRFSNKTGGGDDVNKVEFMAKYVKTEAQVEEHDPVTGKWRFTHRGPFSVLKGGRRVGNTKVMKNVANTSVLSWGGKLLCLWEGGDPYEIQPETLDTFGKVKLVESCEPPPAEISGERSGGVWDVAARLLKPILYGVFKMPPKRLLSHYKLDSRKNRLLMVSCNAEDMLLPRSHFVFYEYDLSFKEVAKHEYTISDHLMIHDWAFTDTHYILFANRIKQDVVGAMTAVCGATPMITALSVNPSKDTSPIYLLPRFPNKTKPTRDWTVPIQAPSQFWLIHVCNAYENTNENNGNSLIQIYGSACSYDYFNFHQLFGYDWQSGKLDPSVMNIKGAKSLPHLVKVTIDLDGDGECRKCDVDALNDWDKSSDFPVINSAFSGTENKYVYAAASSGTRSALPSFPFDMVVKLNAETKSARTWSVGSRRFIGEPSFVARGSEEDEGYILVVEYAVAVQSCYLVILDSKKIGEADALVARLEVPKHLNFPLGFHGFWACDR